MEDVTGRGTTGVKLQLWEQANPISQLVAPSTRSQPKYSLLTAEAVLSLMHVSTFMQEETEPQGGQRSMRRTGSGHI